MQTEMSCSAASCRLRFLGNAVERSAGALSQCLRTRLKMEAFQWPESRLDARVNGSGLLIVSGPWLDSRRVSWEYQAKGIAKGEFSFIPMERIHEVPPLSESTSRPGEIGHSPCEIHSETCVSGIIPRTCSHCLQHIRLLSTFSWFSSPK